MGIMTKWPCKLEAKIKTIGKKVFIYVFTRGLFTSIFFYKHSFTMPPKSKLHVHCKLAPIVVVLIPIWIVSTILI
jgi:hypothetical protein